MVLYLSLCTVLNNWSTVHVFSVVTRRVVC